MNKIFSIALDGPAGAGKSSVAEALAQRLGAHYLDTGAMYRTVGLYFLRLGLIDNPEEMAKRAAEVKIDTLFEGDKQIMMLDGEDVTDQIRTQEASDSASKAGAVPEIRARMVQLQRDLAKGVSIIVDGRDICSVVLPDATLKLYITATAEERALRRYNQLRDKGENVVFHEILDGIVERDYNDSHRETSPLQRAEDAILLDTTHMTKNQVIAEVVRLLEKALEEQS